MSELCVVEIRDETDGHRSRALAVASSFGLCAIFNLKEAHAIVREVESANPARPQVFEPFLEVSVSRSAAELDADLTRKDLLRWMESS